MTGIVSFGWIAGALQLVVPSYALRLVRRFGAHRVGWFLVIAFASLAMLHVLGPVKPAGAGPVSSSRPDLIYAIASVLLLVGMGHVETLFSEREQARSHEKSLFTKLELKAKAEISALLQTKEALLQALARHEQRERDLTEAEAQYRFLFTENPQPLWIFDLRTYRFLAVNNAALRQYGFTAQEFMKLTAQNLFPAVAMATFLKDAANPCRGVQRRGLWQHCKKDGTLLDVEVTGLDLTYAGSPARLILANDITQSRRREWEMRQAYKMEIIGQLAGGFADQFNNILTVIEGHSSLLLHKRTDPASVSSLEQISAASSRGAALTRQLMAIGGRHVLHLEPVDLNAVIQKLTPMLRRLVGDHIVFKHTHSSSAPVMADRYLLDHTIINLVLNARDAMATGGTLTIGTSIFRAHTRHGEGAHQTGAGEFVCLSIRDTGCGMTPEVQSHLFEPFFTTHDNGNGSGLGLASIHGAVKQHAGWIEFSSDVGSGSEFRVFLPCAPSSAALIEKESPAAAPPLTKGTVLLVEPEDRMRGLARCALNWNGYRVIEADGSSTALLLWEGQSSKIDLLLTDINLPGELSGRELANQLQKSKPVLKVLYTADLSPEKQEKNPTPLEGLTFISKPYSRETLLPAVEGFLAHGSGNGAPAAT